MNKMIFFLMVALLLAGPALAQTGKGQATAQQKENIYQELELTAEQKSQLEANRQAQREEREKVMTQLKQKQAELKEELRNPAANNAAVEATAGEIKALQGQLIDLRMQGILAVKQTLSPEQFTKFQQIIEKRKANRGQSLKGLGQRLERRGLAN